MRSSVSFQQRRIDGTFDGHFRGDTHSLLLSMRENGHRKLQLLIDLPNKQVRRIYDGRRSWNFGSSGDPCELDCQLGTVVWEDGEVRDIDSRGFRLDWLHGRHTLRASEAETNKKKKKKKKTGDGRGRRERAPSRPAVAYRASRTKARRKTFSNGRRRTRSKHRSNSRKRVSGPTRDRSRKG